MEFWTRGGANTFPTLSYGDAAADKGVTWTMGANWGLRAGPSCNAVLFGISGLHKDGRWHLVAVSYDGAQITGFLDGQIRGSFACSNLATVVPGQGLSLGRAGGDAPDFAELAIYPTALDASRMQSHYGAGTPVGGPWTGSDRNGRANSCFGCDVQTATNGFLRGVFAGPVDSGSGNMYHDFVDLSIPGRSYPLAFTRTYNSASAGIDGPLGFGWNNNYHMSLAVSGTTATIVQENGSTATFTQSGTTWSPAAPRYIATLTQNGDGTWTFIRHNRDTFTFNSAGQLTAETDLNGYTTTFTSSGGLLTTVADPSGRTLSFTWTTVLGRNVLSSVTDANITPNRTVRFEYNDGAGNLTDAFDVGGGRWQFVYAAHRMTVMKDPKCVANVACPGVQTHYDGQGRVDGQKDQLNRQTSFDYISIVGATKITDPKGNVEVDYYVHGLRVAMTKGFGTPAAATWRFGFDQNTLAPTLIVDPNGHVTTSSYDANGNALTTTSPLGRQTLRTFNALNQVLTARDRNGVTTNYTYDLRGNLTQVSRPLVGTPQSQVTVYNHADAAHPGDVTSMVDADGKTWTYRYDVSGYRNAMTDPLGNTTTFVYNAVGWLLSSTTPKGNVLGCGCAAQFTTSYEHDAFGNLTTALDPLGHQTVRHYDSDQNRDQSRDANGNLTIYVYDLANQLTQAKRADIPQTTLVTNYNPDGTVLDQRDGKGNAVLSYGYDSLTRVTTLTDALSNVTTYSYDGAGNRLTKQDPGGNCAATPKTGCTTFSYDADNELTAVAYSDGVTPNVTNITYDSDGQRTGMTDGTGTLSWVWDSLHRITSYTNGAGAQLQYGYNLRNLVTSIAYPGGNCGTTPTLCVTRGYDDARRWTSVTDWNSNNTNFAYDENSNLTTTTLPPGGGSLVDMSSFDAADRLISMAVTTAGTPISPYPITYSRDAANQLISDSSATAGQNNYKYTALNQVCYAGSSSSSTCASPPAGSQPFAYDAADNLTTFGSAAQQFNAANELCWTLNGSSSNICTSAPAGATTYTYDTRGNRTLATPASGANTCLGYDQVNRMTSYKVGSGSSCTSPTTNASYGVNGDGLRMSKTVGGTTTQFAWDQHAGLPLLIQDRTGVTTTSYIYGPGRLPLEQISNTTTHWLHHDQLGSTRLITDFSGTSQATFAFDPYGNLLSSTGSITTAFRFAGEYQDIESGLYYLRARNYDPTTGQFLTRDPMVASSRNPYAYVNSNPLNARDPSGMCIWIGCDVQQALNNNGYCTINQSNCGNSLIDNVPGVAAAGSAVYQWEAPDPGADYKTTDIGLPFGSLAITRTAGGDLFFGAGPSWSLLPVSIGQRNGYIQNPNFQGSSGLRCASDENSFVSGFTFNTMASAGGAYGGSITVMNSQLTGSTEYGWGTPQVGFSDTWNWQAP
jgi:RHS repeat-associated protein